MLITIFDYAIKHYYKNKRKVARQKFNRALSFGDYLVDRWEKSKFYGFGEGTSVYDNVLILGDVIVGANTWIGPNCILDGSGGGLIIGDNCSIAAGVHIYTHNTVKRATSGGREGIETAPVYIGSDVYIGPNAVVAMGSHIEDKCVIGALTFVNSIRIPEGSKAFGIPATIRQG
jgi:acetyltransferase-like isoleucine patch superfamily enzyme